MPTPRRRQALAPPPPVAARPITLRARGDFASWLADSGGTLAVTTYNSGKLALIAAPGGELVACFWKLPRPMGLAIRDGQLAVAGQDRLWVFSLPDLNIEAVYATGRLDAHDVAFDRHGLLFANTRYNCIARPSERLHFLRHWQPWFIRGVARQDCCHLNGLGVRDGRLAAATAFCESDRPAAWRDGDRFQSGVLIAVPENRIVARGLCMPHSPRWHEGRWWLCDSGQGTLATFDPHDGTCRTVAALPGFTRGLAFGAGRAIVGLSRIRQRHILDAPPVPKRWTALRAGVALVDPSTGAETGSLEFARGGREVYDVAFLPGSAVDPPPKPIAISS